MDGGTPAPAGDPDEAARLRRQVLGLSTLLQLERRLRAGETPQEVAFRLVNETRSLVDYASAVLWSAPGGRVVALSGLAAVDPDAPFVRWVARLVRLAALDRAAAPVPLDAATVDPRIGSAWADFWPAHALWIPLTAPASGPVGGLLLARDRPFDPADMRLAQHVGEAFGHAWWAAGRRRGRLARTLREGRAGWVALAAVVLLGASFAVPVRESALAPAEVVAAEPQVVRAPLDGVIEAMVAPADGAVAAGDLLFRLDRTELDSRRAVLSEALGVADAAWRQMAQRAVTDAESKAELAILRGRREEKAAELRAVEARLARVEVRSPAAGLALYDDGTEWTGRPVELGEKVMTVADPERVQIEIRLPVDDAIAFDIGAPVAFFLNARPDDPLDAHVTRAGYEPQVTPEGTLAYRLEAALDARGAAPRIGLRGTAKLYGAEVSLFAYLFRRPLAAARRWAGI